MKNFKVQYKASFEATFFQFFQGLFTSTRHHLLLSAVCVFDDYMEYCGEFCWVDGSSFIIENLLTHAVTSDAKVRQSALYGIGVAAQFAGELFNKYSALAVQKIQEVLNDPAARTPEYSEATDCAVGAMGKLALFQQAELVPAWLSLLPISEEEDEAHTAHHLFLAHLAQYRDLPDAQRVLSSLRETPDLLLEEDQVLLQSLQ